jgi:hypothetical protein
MIRFHLLGCGRSRRMARKWSPWRRKSVAKHARSEPAIIAGLAKATLKPNPRVDWDGWVADYSTVRDTGPVSPGETAPL